MTVHGEASIAAHKISAEGGKMTQSCDLEQARLHFTRKITLSGNVIQFDESVVNTSSL